MFSLQESTSNEQKCWITIFQGYSNLNLCGSPTNPPLGWKSTHYDTVPSSTEPRKRIKTPKCLAINVTTLNNCQCLAAIKHTGLVLPLRRRHLQSLFIVNLPVFFFFGSNNLDRAILVALPTFSKFAKTPLAKTNSPPDKRVWKYRVVIVMPLHCSDWTSLSHEHG